MQKDLLARDYDIPKKPIFLLDGKDIVQSTDSAAFVSNNVTDSIMYDTNGFIGLRHKSEVETACFATEVLLHGVYHSQTWEGNQSCSALPQERQIGASVCSVRLSCLVDGELGTISSIPHRRLSLEDGAFRSYSTDVTSSDGALVFDADYVRCVDVEDLSVWGEELTFHHFHSLRDRLEQGGVSSEVVSPNQCGAPSMSVYGGLGGGRAPPAEVCSTTKLEFCVSFIVDLAHWSVMETIEMDELLQRSTTSGLCIHSSTDVSCQVCYEDGANEMATPQPLTPVVDIASCTDDADHSGLVFERFPHTTVSAAARQLDADQEVYFGGRVDDHLGGARVSGASSSKCIITKRFVLPVADGCVPKQVIISLRARHMTFDPMLQLCTEPKPFHSLASILERRRSSLQEFWSLYDIDLQLHEELAPNRTRLALLYNAFRLFNVSYNIENGLSRSGCSCPGNGLMLDLTHYIFYGMCFTLTLPRAAMGLLKSLWHLLPQARRNAAMLYLRSGAVYPPHTFNGTSCTTVTAANFGRFHVNPEVGYLIHLYCSAVVDLSDEERLLLLELMLETARVWPQLGEWHENHTSFRIDNIAGADEYNNNNCGNFYIHVSAKCHMDFALQLVKEQESVLGTARVEELLNRLDLSAKELRTMGEVAQAMCMPQSNGHGIYTVHDTFDSLEQWSEERTKHPLSMNYHPLTIYRKKVIDIPEVLLGMLLYPKYFSKMDLERNTMYYRPLCTFDSPEGLAIMAVALCHARGNLAQPIPYLRSLSNLDLDNITYTAEQGLHLGAMSCSLLTVAWGMGGVSCGNNVLSLDPILPAGVARYSFTIHWRGSALRTSLDCDVILFELLSGDSLRFVHRPFDHRIHLHSGLRSCTARRRLEVPRALPNRNNSFDGAVFLCEAVFHNILEYSYVSWLRTLETLFESYRTLHNRPIPRLNPEEFIEAVAYEKEKSEIAYSGIHELLLKRGISLDVGTSEDAEIVETRYGLGNAKLAEMAEMLAKEKPLVNPDLLAMLRNFAQNGIAMAIVTYSRCLNQLLAQNPELADFFVARIDGEEAHNRKIQGRPHVDIHLRAAEKMHVHPSRCIVFSHHLDRDFAAPDLANFRMFLDVEDPFVSSRVAVRPYPTLSDEEAETLKRGNQVVCRLHLGDVPHTVEEVEDIIDGRRVSSANKVRQTTYF